MKEAAIRYTTIQEMVSDLVIIHNDRKANYEKTLSELQEHDLFFKPVLKRLAGQCRAFAEQLNKSINPMPLYLEPNGSGIGNLFRSWKDVKALFASHTPKAILNTCSLAETKVMDLYLQVLNADFPISKELKKLLQTQCDQIEYTQEELLDPIHVHLTQP